MATGMHGSAGLMQRRGAERYQHGVWPRCASRGSEPGHSLAAAASALGAGPHNDAKARHLVQRPGRPSALHHTRVVGRTAHRSMVRDHDACAESCRPTGARSWGRSAPRPRAIRLFRARRPSRMPTPAPCSPPPVRVCVWLHSLRYRGNKPGSTATLTCRCCRPLALPALTLHQPHHLTFSMVHGSISLSRCL